MKDILIGERFQVMESIGTGGEAQVFRASDQVTGQEVALRIGRQPATQTQSCELPLFHPGWVQFLQSGIDPHHGAYQAYELLAGKTLAGVAPLAPDEWRTFVEQSLQAVGALHEIGMIHGDLNADNFLRLDSTPVQWKLLELPFLRFDPPADRSALFGSIHTLAPEQLNGVPSDVRSDLYALGCLYYFAAAGVYPQAGSNRGAIAIERLRFAPEPLHEKAPNLPAPWSAWVMRLLERKPADRYPDLAAAHHLLTTLDQ